MSIWAQSFWLAVLLATIPLMWVYRILQNLPPPILLSHSSWPSWCNMTLISVVTGSVSLFIHSAYDSVGDARQLLMIGLHFLITAVIYVFGFVLLLRQFVGLYPEYFVTTGSSGLSIRKALYRNILDIEQAGTSEKEARLRVYMRGGEHLWFELPARDLPVFYSVIKENQPDL